MYEIEIIYLSSDGVCSICLSTIESEEGPTTLERIDWLTHEHKTVAFKLTDGSYQRVIAHSSIVSINYKERKE